MPLGKTLWRKGIGETNGKKTSSVKFWKCDIYSKFISVKWDDIMAASFRKDGYGILGWNMRKNGTANQGTVFPLVNLLV